MAKANSIMSNFGYNLIYNILNIIVPIITAPYISRVLGVSNIGIYSYTYSWVSTIIMFGMLGTATYGQKEIAAARKNSTEVSSLFWEIYIIKAVTTLMAVIGFIPFMSHSGYLNYFLLEIPFFLAAFLDISWFFQGLEQFRYIALRNIIVRLSGVVLLLLLVKTENHLPVYLLIIGLTQMIGNLSMWPYLKRFLVAAPISRARIVKHFKGIIVYFIPSIAYQIYAVLDKAMLGLLVGSNYENGYYEQAHKIINMVISVITAYTVVMRSRMSYFYARMDADSIKKYLIKSSNVIALLVFPMTFGLAACANGIVPWFFGDGYEQVGTLLIVFSPVFIFMGYSHLIGSHILTPSGRQGQSNIAQCIAAAVNVILNAILIPAFYSLGAAIASVISEIIIVAFYFVFVRNDYSLILAFKTGWKKCLSACLMYFVVFGLSNQLRASIVSSFFEVMVGAVLYFLILFLLKDAFVLEMIQTFLAKVKRKIENKTDFM